MKYLQPPLNLFFNPIELITVFWDQVDWQRDERCHHVENADQEPFPFSVQNQEKT